MSIGYLFRSQRLGFRNWLASDRVAFAEMNADPRVMEHFPSVLSSKESDALMERMSRHFEEHGYTYYAVELLDSGTFIGFIGLCYQEYESPFTPATDIGWRLLPEYWGMGYATEGAQRCLSEAFDELGLDKVISVCANGNLASERVMQKISMSYLGDFDHPKLLDHPDLNPCKCYSTARAH